MERMTTAGLASTFRERQHLHDRIDPDGVPIGDRVLAEVRHQIGLQSQAPLPPYTALWTRIAGFDPLTASALVRSGALVRVVCMRSTIHLVHADDAWSLRSLTAPVLEREFTTAVARRVPGIDVAAVVDRAAATLDGTELPARDLGRDLAARFEGYAPADLVNVVRCHLPLVQRPPRGEWGATGGVVYARLDQHVPVNDVVPGEELRSLALRYLGAYGPATPADFAQWSGLRGAREVFASLGDAVMPVEVEGRTLVDRADVVRVGGDRADGAPAEERATPTARLLADFDAAVLSHADRSRILPDPSVIASPNGLIPATFLVDGVVAGRWTLSIADGEARAILYPMGRLSQRVQSALRRELRSLARTLHGVRLTDTTLSPV